VRNVERAVIGLTGSAQVAAGSEVVINISLPNGASSAQIDLVYDPALLNNLSRAGAEAAAADTGRTTLRIDKTQGGAAATQQARFRAVAKAPATAQVAIDNATIANADGQEMPIELPPPHRINIAP
jgi:hypothetical protein